MSTSSHSPSPIAPPAGVTRRTSIALAAGAALGLLGSAVAPSFGAPSLGTSFSTPFSPATAQAATPTAPVSAGPDDPSGFVLLSDAVPDAILEIRYYATYNFVGARVDGYEQPVALLTREAAQALRGVNDDVIAQGYRLKVFDAYRPQMAVDHFVRWAEDLDDTAMKPYFYPELDKSVLFDQGYIDAKSGHSRGSTVDLTLFNMATGKEVDMGGTFDFFGELSHPDYTGITDEQFANRMILRDAMINNGFRPLATEWWHFILDNEPYPDTYFTFPVSADAVRA